VYRKHPDGWQQNSQSGWQAAPRAAAASRRRMRAQRRSGYGRPARHEQRDALHAHGRRLEPPRCRDGGYSRTLGGDGGIAPSTTRTTTRCSTTS
jgi:hypothetical protein